MKEEARRLLKECPESRSYNLNCSERLIIVKAVLSIEGCNVGKSLLLNKIESFLRGWLSVKQTIGYIVSMWDEQKEGIENGVLQDVL